MGIDGRGQEVQDGGPGQIRGDAFGLRHEHAAHLAVVPRATILDLLATPISPKNLPWTQGVQSFPLLLDYKGNIRVRDSEKTANRTVIATDRVGNILIFNTSNRYFTLRELAQFLKASKFDIDSALNLDGGTEAQLLIKTKDFEFFSPPSWEHSIGNILDQSHYWLPTVVGYSRSGLIPWPVTSSWGRVNSDAWP